MTVDAAEGAGRSLWERIAGQLETDERPGGIGARVADWAAADDASFVAVFGVPRVVLPVRSLPAGDDVPLAPLARLGPLVGPWRSSGPGSVLRGRRGL